MGQKEEEKEENISCVILTFTFIFIFKREINENNRITNVRTEKNRKEQNRTSLAVKEDMKESDMSRYEKISGYVSV